MDTHAIEHQDVVASQQTIIKDFFKKDSSSEMIESLNTLIEAYLFTDNLATITPEMREHIVNQLRVTTLIAKLDASNSELSIAASQIGCYTGTSCASLTAQSPV